MNTELIKRLLKLSPVDDPIIQALKRADQLEQGLRALSSKSWLLEVEGIKQTWVAAHRIAALLNKYNQ